MRNNCYSVHSACSAVNQNNSCEQSTESDRRSGDWLGTAASASTATRTSKTAFALSVPLSFFSKSSALVTCVHFQHISSSPCSSFYFHVSRAPLKNFFHAKVHLLLGIKRRKELASSFLDQTRASGAGFLSASLLLFLFLAAAAVAATAASSTVDISAPQFRVTYFPYDCDGGEIL
jgi:hypothetical protein